MTNFQSSPFDALKSLQSLVQSSNDGPVISTTEQWVGVAYNLGGKSYVSDMGQVGEVLTPPTMTAIPGVKSWVLGVSNIRGRLVPIVDLVAFFDMPKPADSRRQRIITVELGDSYIGILVDQVFGMRHFSVTDFDQTTDSVISAEQPTSSFVTGVYGDAERQWALFDLFKLIFSDSFKNVAA